MGENELRRSCRSDANRVGERSRRSCCSLKVVKCCVLLFNSILLLCGILVAATSTWTHFSQRALLSLLSERNVTFPTVVNLSAAVAAILVVASVIGSVSAATENRCLLAFAILLLVFLFLAELFSGVISYFYFHQVERDLANHLKVVILNGYGQQKHITNGVDKIQRELQCCGLSSFEDWLHSRWFTTMSGRNRVPDSCCKTESEGCGVREHPSNIPYTGCLHPLSHLIRSHLVVLWSLSFSTCTLLAIGFCYSSSLYIRLGNLQRGGHVKEESNQELQPLAPLARTRTRLKTTEKYGQIVSDKSIISTQRVVPSGRGYRPLLSNKQVLVSRRHSLG